MFTLTLSTIIALVSIATLFIYVGVFLIALFVALVVTIFSMIKDGIKALFK